MTSNRKPQTVTFTNSRKTETTLLLQFATLLLLKVTLQFATLSLLKVTLQLATLLLLKVTLQFATLLLPKITLKVTPTKRNSLEKGKSLPL